MKCTFVVGQKVQYIGGDLARTNKVRSETLPEHGETYTVREVLIAYGVPALRLKEIKNPVVKYRDGPDEACWKAALFRPLHERKTSIECFTALLNSIPSREKVE